VIWTTGKGCGETNTMNDWQKILVKRKQVDQMKNNNQELYDQLGRAKMYVLRYA